VPPLFVSRFVSSKPLSLKTLPVRGTMLLLNTLRRLGSLLLTLAMYLIGPVLMLVVCCCVLALVAVTQFLFALPLLAPLLILPFAIYAWTDHSALTATRNTNQTV
jgi:hypothetical protein